jgi:DNA-binding protein
MTTKNQKLKVISADFRAVLGIEELSLEPGKITVLEGKNAAGKSSVLKAIQAALGRGNLMELRKINSAEKPEVVLVAQSDTNEYRISRKGEKLRVQSRVGDTAAFEDIRSPVAWLSGLFDGQGCNPIKFKQADDKTKAIMILEALTLDLDRDALWAELGIDREEIGPVPDKGLHPLEELAWIRREIYTTRTGVNRDAQQKHGSAEQLKREIPAVVPDIDEDINRLEEHISNVTLSINNDHHEAQKIHDEQERSAIEECTEQVQELRSAYEAEAARKRAELEASLSAAKDLIEKAVVSRLETRAQKIKQADANRAERQIKIAAAEKELSAHREQLAALKIQRDNATKAKALQQQAEQFEADAIALKAKSERLTTAIDALDSFRSRLADDLPIPGLKIEDNEITVNGVKIDQLNDAQQLEIGTSIAIERAKKFPLPLVYIDGFETLDTENQRRLIKRFAAEPNIQVIMARVTDSKELEVKVA